MMSEAMPVRHRAWFEASADADRWRYHLVLLAVTWTAIATVFADDIVAMVASWSRTGAFNHCFLILPLVVWIVWRRRVELTRLAPEFSWTGVAIIGAAGLIRAAGEAGYVALLRQAGAVIAAQGAVVALLGRPVSRALLFPLLFALFLIPAGSELEPLLQHWTADAAVALLRFAGTPASVQGVVIGTPAGLFRVAEACSGVGFLLAMAAFSALVGLLCFRSTNRRLLFFAAAMTAALLANVLRAFLIMQAANIFGIQSSFVSDHLLYGWVLFALILVLLWLAASRWFDRATDDRDIDPAQVQGAVRRRRPARYLAGVSAALLLPQLWLGLTAPAADPPSPMLIEPAVAGWQRVMIDADPHWSPRFEGATWIGQWRFANAEGRTVDLAVVQFDRQDEGTEIVGFGQGAVGIEVESGWYGAGIAPPPEAGSGEWLRSASGRSRYAATFYLVGDLVTGSRMLAKGATMAMRLLTGRGTGASVVIVSADGETPEQAALSAARFLKAAGSAKEIADRAGAIR